MSVFYKDELQAYRYVLSQKRLRDKPTFDSAAHSKTTINDRTKTEISSYSKNETSAKPEMYKNVRPHVKSPNEVKITRVRQSDPRGGAQSTSRNDMMSKATMMYESDSKNQTRLRHIQSSSSTSSTRKACTPSSSSYGDGILKKGSADRKTKSPALPVSKKTLYPSESVIVGWKMSFPIGSGFVNMGNTCYLNSTLQALFHVPSFVYWLVNDDNHARKCAMIHQRSCLICPVVKTLLASHKQSGNAIRPTEIYSRLPLICKHLRRGSQEDAHEFLRYLLEGMERSYLACYKPDMDNLVKETTPIGQIFGGYIRTEVACLECGHVSTTFQHFQDLILDIQSASSVDEALDQYFTTEDLGDGYKCDKCKKRIAATKKFFLERPPKVLCVQLKRFEALGGKNNKHVSFKQGVDLDSFLHSSSKLQQLKYKLVSMILHHGHSSVCGHYTAVGLTSTGGYYLFDDSDVSPMLLSDVLKTNPYILMYELHTRASLSVNPSTSSPLELSRNVTRNYRRT